MNIDLDFGADEIGHNNSYNYKVIYESELGVQLKVKSNGFSDNIRCPFPDHDDKNPSFAVNIENGVYKCHGCNRTGNVFTFYREKYGYDNKTIIEMLSNIPGSNVSYNQQKKPPSPPPRQSKPSSNRTLLDKYNYYDENSVLKYKVEKYLINGKKQFYPSRYENGKFSKGIKGFVNPLPYNLPAVSKAEAIFIVEGEKDVNTLTKLNLVASCNSGGANGWNSSLNKYFSNKKIIIIPDNDKPGENYVNSVAKNLNGIATSIKVVRLPGLNESEDISDYINEYKNTKENLLELVENANVYEQPKVADKKVKKYKKNFLAYYDQEKRKYKLIQQNRAARAIVDYNKLENFIYDYISKAWYKYNEDTNKGPKGIWICIPDEEFLAKVVTIIDAHGGSWIGYSASYLEGTVKFLKIILRVDLVKAKAETKNLLNFQNGVLNCETMSFSSHSHKYYQTSQFPHDYSPDATCDNILKWLHQMTDGANDVAKVILAFLNAILLSRSDLQKYLQLIGPGGSGKGTLMNLAVELIGEQNIYSTTFKKLAQNSFISASFYGKKLLLIPDADPDVKNLELFKSITGNDPLPYEEKYKQSRGTFRFTGMVIVSANQYMQIDDNSSAFQRRTIAINFDKVIPQHKQIDILPQLTKEMPGLINHILSFSKDEVTQTLKQTELSSSLHDMKIKSLVGTNHIADWILANTTYDHENGSMQVGRKMFISISRMVNGKSETVREFRNSGIWAYPNYCTWCEQIGIKHQKLDTFREQVVDICKNTLHYNYVHQKRIDNKRMIMGLQLKEDASYSLNIETVKANAKKNIQQIRHTNNNNSHTGTI